MKQMRSIRSSMGYVRYGVRSNCGNLIEMLESRVMLSSYYLDTLATFNTGPMGTGNNVGGTSIVMDSSGNIFGSTYEGGPAEQGSLFEIPKSTGVLKTLFEFNQTDGIGPAGALVVDANGDVFGACVGGGGTTNYGTVFELVNTGSAYSFKTLVVFDGTDGNGPGAGLVIDKNGDLFGTTETGGGSTGLGTIFELVNDNGSYSFQNLAVFTVPNGNDANAPDGALPAGNLILDAKGDIFGQTLVGGANTTGTVFELVKSGNSFTLTVLASFDKSYMSYSTNIIMDSNGDIFGTQEMQNTAGNGNIFELTKSISGYALTDIADFNGTNGSAPSAGLAIDSQGNLYGATNSGGQFGNGTIFEVIKTNENYAIQTLVSLDDAAGSGSRAIFRDSSGNIFGTTWSGGVDDVGAVFEVTTTPPMLTFGGVPQSTTAGSAIKGVSVGIYTSQGQLITSDNSPVTLSIAAGPGSLSGTVTAHVVNGIATFSNIIINTAGTYQLYASDGTDNPTVSAAFTVSTAAAAKLVFAAAPRNTTAGAVFNPPVVVYVMDKYGNIVRNVNTPVTLFAASAPGKVFGTTTVNLNNGAAIFSDVWLQTAGNYTLTAKAASLASITSAIFSVSPAAAAQLVFTPTPVGAKHGSTFVIAVLVEDAYGNVLTTDNSGTVTLSLNTHPAGAALSGTLTANVVNGLAGFINLSVNLAGSYSLQAGDDFGIAASSSPAFNVS